jgi:hypothetical protein
LSALSILEDANPPIWDCGAAPEIGLKAAPMLALRRSAPLATAENRLKGMPEALGAMFPATTLQTCIVHLIRNSLDYASWKDRKLLAAAIKPIYTAPSAEAAHAELDALEQGTWGPQVPHRRGRLAPRLGPCDPVPRVPADGASGDLHDQRDQQPNAA